MADVIQRKELKAPFEVNRIEVGLEGQPVHVEFIEEQGFFLWFLVDDEMPEVPRNFWVVQDNQDVAYLVPEDEEWSLNVVGTVLIEGRAYHIIEGVE